MQKTLTDAKGVPALSHLTDNFEAALNRLSETALYLAKTAMSDNILNAFAFAHPFLDVTGDVTFAWMHLWRATVAIERLTKLAGSDDWAAMRAKAEKNKDAAFYYGQLKTAEFFMRSLLPVTMGKFNAIEETNGAAVDMLDGSFAV